MKYRGIVFDFNGTMFFDGEFQEKSWKEFVSRLIGREVTEEEFKTYIHGRNAVDTFSYFLNREVSARESAELEEEKEKIYRELCLESEAFRLAPGLVELLNTLKERGIPMTIATASGKGNVDFFFEHLDLARWFDRDKVVYNDGTLAGKPDPEIYERAIKLLGLSPEEILVFEDAPSGILSAKSAGADVVCLDQVLGEEELLELGADAVISDFNDLKLA